MSFMKKMMLFTVTVVMTLALMIVGASACTMIYVGSDLTEDGATYFARSEDISNSYNKVFYVSEAGTHKAGEVYNGCYGFTWTFTKDSYAYTAFRDDNFGEECPDCGGTHVHMPYEAAGTNSEGLTVTATVTLSSNSAVREADPMIDTGIEEAEIPTILLSEAATAREALDLLIQIYETQGATGRSGIIVADQTEAWYIENYTGTQYIAIKLPADMIFISPNMGTLGLIDLDDENVIASEDLIAVAQTAETFVGNAEENQIDVRASYSNTSINARMTNGLNYLNEAYAYTAETITSDDFTVSNVAADGTVTGFYTDIEADRVITIEDMVDFYKVDGIGNTSNLEYHIFQIRPEGNEATATVEWVGMDHGAYGVTIPYYPMLLNDTYEGYQVGNMVRTTFAEELPEDAVAYYPGTTTVKDEEGNRVTVEGYKVLPEGWETSYYWCFDLVSNYILSDPECTPEMEQLIVKNYAAMQDTIYATFENMEEDIVPLVETDYEQARADATTVGKALAEASHKLARDLYFYAREAGLVKAVILSDEDVPTLYLPENYTTEGQITNESEIIVYNEEETAIRIPLMFFDDVISTDWFADYVRFVAEFGIMNGTGNNLFAPESEMTRAMLATVLYRLDGSPDVSDLTTPFTDIAADTWYTDAVVWAYNAGVVNGVSETAFEPDANITREQLVTMLYRFADYVGMDITIGEETNILSYVDGADVSEFAVAPMQWAVSAGIIEGIETADGLALDPHGNATRAQIATMIVRFLQAV